MGFSFLVTLGIVTVALSRASSATTIAKLSWIDSILQSVDDPDRLGPVDR